MVFDFKILLIYLFLLLDSQGTTMQGNVNIIVEEVSELGVVSKSYQAEIHIDSENDPPKFKKPFRCKTNEEGICSFGISIKTHWFRASKDFFRPLRKAIVVDSTEITPISFKIYHQRYEGRQKEKISSLRYSDQAKYIQAREELREYYQNYGDEEELESMKN